MLRVCYVDLQLAQSCLCWKLFARYVLVFYSPFNSYQITERRRPLSWTDWTYLKWRRCEMDPKNTIIRLRSTEWWNSSSTPSTETKRSVLHTSILNIYLPNFKESCKIGNYFRTRTKVKFLILKAVLADGSGCPIGSTIPTAMAKSA